jgi:hypothetical protein
VPPARQDLQERLFGSFPRLLQLFPPLLSPRETALPTLFLRQLRQHIPAVSGRIRAPEHLEELPPLGDAFIVAAVIGGLLALALVFRPGNPMLPLLAALFCLGQIGAWALFVTLPLPGFAGTPESVEAIALVSKAVEALGVLLALSLITSPLLGRPRRSLRPHPLLEDA